MGTTSQKLTYLNVTKQKLKQAINNIGGEVTDETTFRNYVAELENAYDRLPKTEFEEGESVTLENTLKGKLDFQDGKVGFGQSSQKTTNGYQLLDINATSGTKNGATWVVNEDKSITLKTNGATTGLVTIPVVTSKTLEAGTYYASGVTGGTENTYYFGILKNDWVFRNFNGITQFSVSEQTSYSQIWIVIATGTTISTPITIYPMISKVNTSDYEQYTGGYSSPSPNWKQEVKYVAGKNKLPTYEIKKFTASADAWCSLDGIGNFYNQTNIAPSKVFCILKANQTYTISVYQKANTNNVQLVDYTGTVLLTGLETQAEQYTPSTDIKVYPRLKVTNSNTETYCYIQIEEGSIVHPYLPYNTIEEVVRGINICDKENEIRTGGSVLSGDTTRLSISLKEKLKANTKYTLVTNLDLSSFYYAFVLGRNVAPWTLGNQIFDSGWQNVSHYTYETTQECYMNIPIRNSSNTDISINDVSDYWFMVYEGEYDSNISFEPYKTPKTYQFSLGDHKFYGIGTYRDYILRTTGKNLFDDSIKEAYYYNSSGERTPETSSSLLYSNQEYKITDQKITISFRGKVEQQVGQALIRLCEYNGDTFIKRTLYSSQGTITLDPNTTRIITSVNNSDATHFVDLMIEIGSTVSDYQPFGVGNWYKVGEIGEVTLNGTTFAITGKSNSTANNVFFSQSVADIINLEGNDNVIPLLSNYFVGGKSTNQLVVNNILGIGVRVGRYLAIGTTLENTNNTVELMNTWLTTHNTNVCYPLDTPTYTQITGTLAEQLEAWWNGQSLDGTTIIEGNGDLPMIIKVRGLKGE